MTSTVQAPPTAHSFVLHYANSCIMFNMVKCSRVKKQSSNDHDDDNHGSSDEVIVPNDEEISELWENDEELHLVLRLLKNEQLPWLVSHYGSREIVKAPLVIPIRPDDVDGSKVSIWLRDFAGRGDNCIKRKFYLEFPSSSEADIFRYSHNKLLNEYLSGKDTTRAVNDTKKVQKNNIHNTTNEEDSDEESSCPPIKKARIAVENDQERYDQIVDQFHVGDDHDFLDDCYPETQNPYGDDDDYE